MDYATKTSMRLGFLSRPLCLMLVLGLCWLVAGAVDAQSKESKPATKKETSGDAAKKVNKSEDGYDRPTTYPRIRFKAKPDDKSNPKDATKTRTRVYLLDVSNAMNASVSTKEGRETTRLARMTKQMKATLDSLAKRGNTRFNFVTFGSVQDLTGGKDPWLATDDNVKAAKKWLDDLVAEGDTDIFPLLKELFDQDPGSAYMVVGGAPSDPDGVSKKELNKAGGTEAYILAKVKAWRKSGKSTNIDISGIDLGKDERAFYKKLARAAGGTYLDI